MATAIPVRTTAFKNILVATDFSSCSEALLPYARSLALRYSSTLFLTHVISPEMLGMDAMALETAHKNAEELMTDVESSEELDGIELKRILEEGDTWSVIEGVIQREHIDLVMVGTHGRTGLKKLVLGSVAEMIFRKSPCPVLTIGPSVEAESKREAWTTHVLLAHDMKPGNDGPMIYAASIAKQDDSQLTLLHVVEKDADGPTPQDMLDLLPKHIELTKAPDALVEKGEVPEKILEVATTCHADLIVLGAPRPAMMGAHVAYRVVCEAPCPVLSVGPKFGE